MSNYTVKHNDQNQTFIETSVTNNGFKEMIQYEFKELITKKDIDVVYNNMTATQQDAVTTKGGFKQFVRLVLLANPEQTDKTENLKLRHVEAKNYISRVAKILGVSVSDAVNVGYITGGSISNKKYEQTILNHPRLVKNEEHDVMYIELDGFVVAAGMKPAVAKSKDDRYIYAMFSIPTKD